MDSNSNRPHKIRPHTQPRSRVGTQEGDRRLRRLIGRTVSFLHSRGIRSGLVKSIEEKNSQCVGIIVSDNGSIIRIYPYMIIRRDEWQG
jgi:hypothetical protein